MIYSGANIPVIQNNQTGEFSNDLYAYVCIARYFDPTGLTKLESNCCYDHLERIHIQYVLQNQYQLKLLGHVSTDAQNQNQSLIITTLFLPGSLTDVK